MIELQKWTKYGKSISTNQLIDRRSPDFKKSRIELIRLENQIFKADFIKGHSDIFYYEDCTIGAFLEKYQLFEQNLIRLLSSNYKIFWIHQESDVIPMKTKILYSSYYHKEFHEVAKNHKLFYITLIK